MKKIFIFFLLLLSVSCINRDKINFERELAAIEVKNDSIRANMATKVVELGFMNFILGSPFSKSVKAAKTNKEITITKTSDESIEFDSFLIGKSVSCKVCSFQDTITSLVILSKDASMQGIEDVYREKYGECIGDSFKEWEWRFKNAGIQIVVHSRFTERVQVKKGYESLRDDNRLKYEVVTDSYFEMLSITYNDFKQVEKVQNFGLVERVSDDSLQNIRNKYIEDSLKKITQQIKEKTLRAI